MGLRPISPLVFGVLLALQFLGEPAHAASISVTMSNPACVQVLETAGICSIQIGSVVATGSDSTFSRLEVMVDGKLRVFMGGFFESSALFAHSMMPAGLTVACGLPNASGSPNYGKAYPVAANAYMADGTSANSTVNVFCPAYIAYPINASASPVAGGTASCTPSPVADGSNSTCTATPNAGYAFTAWSGDCTGATCVLSNVTAAKSVTANFAPLTVPGSPAILSITPGPGHLTITLQPPSNTGGGAIVGYSATCTTSGHPSVAATSTTTTLVVPGLVPGVSYTCTATASNGSYSSVASTAASAIPKPRVDLTPILMLLLD